MKRKSRRAYYHREPEPNALERVVNAILGTGPLSSDPGERWLQMRFQSAMAPWALMLGLAVLGLGGLAFCLWKLIEAALMRGPMGRVYGASRAVRRQLLKKRKASTRLPPTPEALEAAWAKSRRSLEWKLRLGSMLEDLEPAVDQSYIRDDEGTIVGREPGIRGWLMEHCVEVFDHYKTAMGYKALAHRFRLAIDLPEPFTLEDVLDALSESIESIEGKEKVEREAGRTEVKNSEVCAVAKTAAGAPTGGAAEAPEAPRGGAAEPAVVGAVKGVATDVAGSRVLPPPLRGTPLSEGGINEEDIPEEGIKEEGVPKGGITRGGIMEERKLFTSPHCPQMPIAPNCSQMTTIPNHNAVVEKASGEAVSILATLRKRNRKDGRAMRRSMGTLDEILHNKLKLLHVPRSA